jgi:hypothetical protein
MMVRECVIRMTVRGATFACERDSRIVGDIFGIALGCPCAAPAIGSKRSCRLTLQQQTGDARE